MTTLRVDGDDGDKDRSISEEDSSILKDKHIQNLKNHRVIAINSAMSGFDIANNDDDYGGVPKKEVKFIDSPISAHGRYCS